MTTNPKFDFWKCLLNWIEVRWVWWKIFNAHTCRGSQLAIKAAQKPMSMDAKLCNMIENLLSVVDFCIVHYKDPQWSWKCRVLKELQWREDEEWTNDISSTTHHSECKIIHVHHLSHRWLYGLNTTGMIFAHYCQIWMGSCKLHNKTWIMPHSWMCSLMGPLSCPPTTITFCRSFFLLAHHWPNQKWICSAHKQTWERERCPL